MKFAFCSEDGKTYGVDEFSRSSQPDLARKRRLLQCPKCGGPAFFRAASFNGRASCFGARPHAEGCSLATQDALRPDDGIDDPDALVQSGRKIVVDFNYGTSSQPSYFIEAAKHNYDYANGYRPDAPAYRRLSSLLRTLIKSPDFRTSDQRIEALDQPEMAVRDFFVPLLSVSEAHNGLTRGYWGLISDARMSDDRKTVWFNSGGLDTISFCMDTKHLEEFNRRYRFHDAEDLAGAYILVMGTVHVSPIFKIFCVIEELDHMALRLT